VSDPPTRLRAPGPAPAPAAGFRLVFTRGEGLAGIAVPLEREVTFGRDPGCDVVLRDGDVSRRHARVVPRDGGHLLVDLGSTNGTFVNGQPVRRVELQNGTRVTLGRTTLVFRRD
jgi:two-component system, cell cycle response regulator